MGPSKIKSPQKYSPKRYKWPSSSYMNICTATYKNPIHVPIAKTVVYLSVLLAVNCCSVPLSTIQRLQHMENLVIHIFDQTFRKCKDAEIWISTLWWCLWIVHPLFLFDFEFDFPLRVSNQGRSVLTSSLCCWFFFVTGNFWKQGMCHMQFIRSTAGLFDLFESEITLWNIIFSERIFWKTKKHYYYTGDLVRAAIALFFAWLDKLL